MREIWKKKKILISLLVVVVLLIIGYLLGLIYYQGHFLNKTTINGVDCSNLTPDEAVERIKKEVNTYVLTIQERNDITEEINGSDIELELGFHTDMEDVLDEQSSILWFVNYFITNNVEVEENWTYNEARLEDHYNNLACFTERKVVKPQDVTISDYTKDVGYTIVDAVQGNQVKKEEFFSYLKEAVDNLQDTISIEEVDCYEKPSVTEASDEMKAAVELANKYASTNITYTFGDTKEIVDGEKISQWITFDDSYQVTLDETKVAEYVSYLYSKYTTFGRTRTFKTSYNKTIQISGGDYGWWINRTAQKNQILEAIKAGEQGDKDVIYIQTADCYGEQDYGNTYVEINLTAQHLFLYVDGVLVTESDFVSGNVLKGHATPAGTYVVQYKEKDATLVGEDYESKVKYWIPFNGNIGLHDASWRDKFGGTIYKKEGSHGCVNLPYDIAETIYQNIGRGTPVFCYELEGTESDTITDLKAKGLVKKSSVVSSEDTEEE